MPVVLLIFICVIIWLIARSFKSAPESSPPTPQRTIEHIEEEVEQLGYELTGLSDKYTLFHQPMYEFVRVYTIAIDAFGLDTIERFLDQTLKAALLLCEQSDKPDYKKAAQQFIDNQTFTNELASFILEPSSFQANYAAFSKRVMIDGLMRYANNEFSKIKRNYIKDETVKKHCNKLVFIAKEYSAKNGLNNLRVKALIDEVEAYGNAYK